VENRRNPRTPIAKRETDPAKYNEQIKRLRFQDEIEKDYRAHVFPDFLLGMRIGVAFAILINLGFYFVDRQIFELAPHLSWINTWRFQIALPILAVIGGFSFYLRDDLALNIIASVGLVTTSLLVLAIMAPLPVPVKDYYWTGLNIVVLYPFLLMNMRYRFAAVCGLATFLLFLFSGSSLLGMSHGGFMSAVGILATALAMGAVGGYALERYKRRDFLQRYLTQQTVNDLQRSNVKLESLSHMDPLADIPNRRYFDSNYEKEWGRCRRNHLPITVLLVDIDRFKLYNDSYGHPAGDHVLRQVAKTIKQALRRPSDFVARYGGEEFAVVLADTSESGARETGNRILADIRKLYISHDYREDQEAPYITVSIGAATEIPDAGSNADALVEAADQALYEAKRAGRDQIVTRKLDLESVS